MKHIYSLLKVPHNFMAYSSHHNKMCRLQFLNLTCTFLPIGCVSNGTPFTHSPLSRGWDIHTLDPFNAGILETAVHIQLTVATLPGCRTDQCCIMLCNIFHYSLSDFI